MLSDDNKEPRSEYVMYLGMMFLCLVLVSMLIIFGSCRSPKIIEKVETRIEYRDRTIKDTVEIEIPKEVIKNVTTDTTSIVETSLARSEAVVTNGLLFHSIENKPQKLQKPVTITVTDTLYISNSDSQEIPEPEIKYVEKKLTWWQRIRLDTYYILLVLIAGYIIIRYRKGIFSFIKKML